MKCVVMRAVEVNFSYGTSLGDDFAVVAPVGDAVEAEVPLRHGDASVAADGVAAREPRGKAAAGEADDGDREEHEEDTTAIAHAVIVTEPSPSPSR